MNPPALSVVLLTLNEERNIRECLASLAAQTSRDFEVIVVDAASQDRTVEIVRELQATFPVPLRLEAATRRLPIGEARNLGVGMSESPYVAFLSADAEPQSNWVEVALEALRDHDMVFGRQLHTPKKWTVGAAVRGLRYHFPRDSARDPLLYASNVASAYKREILKTFPFDPWANAAEDLLLAKRAHAAGFRAVYRGDLVVRHKDVADARQELVKSVREGEGWGLYRDELGLFLSVIAWGGLLALAVIAALVHPGRLTLAILVGILWLPALRRALRRLNAMPAGPLALGVLASPVFDFVFLLYYLRGLRGPAPRRPRVKPTETHV